MVKIRNYKKGDEEAVIEVVKTVLEGHSLKLDLSTTDSDLIDIEESYIKNGGYFIVLEDRGRIIGSCGLYREADEVMELRKMYLYKEYQGRGLGKQMMNLVFEKCKERGIKEIILETNSVLQPAIKLYEKYGFERYDSDHLASRCDIRMKYDMTKLNQ